MSKTRKGPLRIRIEYAAARALAGLLYLLPFRPAVLLGQGLALVLFALDRRHRERCTGAIRAALHVERGEARRLARAMYLHLGTLLAEFPRIAELNRDTLEAHVDWGAAPEEIERLLARGRGVIFITGHIGNWELCGSAFAVRGYSKGAVARPLDNPRIDAWIRGLRESRGQEIWDKFGAMREALRALREGRGFGILIDQDGGRDGVFAPFFGRTASSMPAAADLALRTGAPLMAAAFHRTGPMRFRLEVSRPFYATPGADRAEERVRLVARCNAELEAIIRKRPEQWLWLHRRWKTEPRVSSPPASPPPS
ncbi:MAG: lysophospholipid acyltransferase family protein [Planctomycetota bacterium]